MSVYHFTGASMVPTGTTNQNLAQTTSKVFTFLSSNLSAVTVKKSIVQNHPDSGGYLYVKWNDTAASATSYDVCLSPGDAVVSQEGLLVTSVALFATVAMTYGTAFVVVGWK
jgi:hypothetical protein